MGGLRSCLNSMLKEGGVLSMWRGNFVNVLKIAPESALKFMAYEQGKRFIKGNSNRELRIEERFLAGSVAGAFSQTMIYPLEVVKTRLALRRTGECTCWCFHYLLSIDSNNHLYFQASSKESST